MTVRGVPGLGQPQVPGVAPRRAEGLRVGGRRLRVPLPRAGGVRPLACALGCICIAWDGGAVERGEPQGQRGRQRLGGARGRYCRAAARGRSRLRRPRVGCWGGGERWRGGMGVEEKRRAKARQERQEGRAPLVVCCDEYFIVSQDEAHTK